MTKEIIETSRRQPGARRRGLQETQSELRLDAPLGRSLYESERLTNVLNRRADLKANCVFIGPTALDFSMLPASAMIPRSEAKLMAQWKEKDLETFYAEQRR